MVSIEGSHPRISYAQNSEDVVLWRVFGQYKTGFYIDIGASHPSNESVTKIFYEQGWSGINVEPCSQVFDQLAAERPRDVNLNCGVAEKDGRLPFFELRGEPGSSSFVREFAEARESDPAKILRREIEVRTLESICREHAVQGIDFLKIDVEGFESQVISGANWERWRPRVLVVESTAPHSGTPTHLGWEPHILSHRYLFCLFDGLNRFYVREEDENLAEALGVPANVLDRFVPYWHVQEVRDLQRMNEGSTKRVLEKEAEIQTSKAYVVRLHEHIDNLSAEIESSRNHIQGQLTEIENLELQKETARTHIGHIESHVQDLTQELLKSQEHHHKQLQEIKNLREEIGAAQTYVRHLEAHIDELSSELQRCGEHAKKQVAEIESQRLQIEEASVQIARFEDLLRGRTDR